MKKNAAYVGLILLVLALVLVLQPGSNKSLNWERTYKRQDKIPFGTYIFHELLEDYYGPATPIIHERRTPYEYVEPIQQRGTFYHKGQEVGLPSLFFISSKIQSRPDDPDWNAMKALVDSGGHVLMAARHFTNLKLHGQALRTKGFRLRDTAMDRFEVLRLPGGQDSVAFEGPRAQFASFSAFPDSSAVLLRNSSDEPVMLAVPHGRGFFFFSSTPELFSNYFLMKEGVPKLTEHLLHYLPQRPIIWSDYITMGRGQSQNRLRFIHSNEALQWGWALALLGFLVFLAFESKRRQRIVPVKQKLQNSVLDFAKMMGRFYYREGNHANLAHKMIHHFLELVRSHYYLPTHKLDKRFAEDLAAKSGFELKHCQNAVNAINYFQQQERLSDTDLLRLNRLLEPFFLAARAPMSQQEVKTGSP